MAYLTITNRPEGTDSLLISHQAQGDLRVIAQALNDETRRDLAEAALALAAAIVNSAYHVSADTTPLTDEERAALAMVGIDSSTALSEEELLLSSPVVEGIRRRVVLTRTALPLSEAAARLGISEAGLGERISERTLVAVPEPYGESWLIPTFQLMETGELPHLRQVLGAATRPIPAVALESFFGLSNEDLEGLSPRQWLLAGRDPTPVEHMIADL